MKVECQWIAANLEAYFCGNLSSQDEKLARTHLESCQACRSETEALERIDPLLKRYFQHELAVAKAPVRRRAWIAPAGAAVLASFLLAAVMFRSPELIGPPDPAPAVAATPRPAQIGPAELAGPKDREVPPPFRAKPEAADQQAVSPPASNPLPQDSAQEFFVMDPAGYSRTVEDYRGYVLLMGVWNLDQPLAAANLEQLYRTFGPDARVRILGVSNQRLPKPSGTTFPVAYNQGSRLFGAASGDFVVLDQTGVVKIRGSLLSDSANIANAVRTALR